MDNQSVGSRFDKVLLDAAHKHSIFHKEEILNGDKCACFHCLKIFHPIKITQWVEEGDGKEETALCPYCGIDSVLGSESKYQIDNLIFLKAMNKRWFGD